MTFKLTPKETNEFLSNPTFQRMLIGRARKQSKGKDFKIISYDNEILFSGR